MKIIFLKNILILKIRILLSLTIIYTFNKAYNIKYKLYKNLKNNTI